MPFKKGTSGFPQGRPKGSKNKPVRQRLEALIKRNIVRIEKEIDDATPQQRRGFLVDLSAALSNNYVINSGDAGD